MMTLKKCLIPMIYLLLHLMNILEFFTALAMFFDKEMRTTNVATCFRSDS